MGISHASSPARTKRPDARSSVISLRGNHATPLRSRAILRRTVARYESKTGCGDKKAPILAAAALTPHNGENGLFGMEEIEILHPAVEEMAAKGIDCSCPFPSDAVCLKAFSGEHDSVLSMYHNHGQGQVATKLQ